MTKKENKECFVVMPISEVDGYNKGHFLHVYEDIIKPAVAFTEFTAIRADEVKETNFIHLDMLKKLIDRRFLQHLFEKSIVFFIWVLAFIFSVPSHNGRRWPQRHYQ